MHATRVAGLIAVLLLFADVVIAQEDLLDEPRRLEQVTFSSPKNASIRLTSGVRRTGRIVSISRETMVYQVGRDNKEVSVEIDDIRRINTLDNEFTYEPATEDFERLKVKAARLGFLRVETVQTYVPPPEGYTPADPPPAEEISLPPTTPETGLDMRPEYLLDPETGLPGSEEFGLGTQPALEEISDEAPLPGSTVRSCTGCQGELPPAFQPGERCPHCDKILWNIRPIGSVPRPQTPGNGEDLPPGVPAEPLAPGDNPNPGVPNAPSVPAGQSPGGGDVGARGGGLADVPVWMQVGFFVGILVIGYVILQRR